MKHLLNHFEKYLSVAFTVLMILSLVCQILSRHILKMPMVWTEEVALICFILSVYTGACNAVTTRQHLKLGIIQEKMPPRVKLIMQLVSNLLFGVTMGAISYGMYFVVAKLVKYKSVYMATGLPKMTVYATIMAMMLLMIIRLIQDSVRLISEYKKRGTV